MPKDPAVKNIEQDVIIPPDFTLPPNRRVGQKDIMPLANKFRLIEFYDPTDNTIKFRDSAGTVFLTFNLNTGVITIATATTFTGSVTKGVSVASFVKEIYFSLMARGSSVFTDATTYQNLNFCEFLFNKSDYPGTTIFLEAICRAGANGDTLRTLSIDLYNVTTGASVTGSEMTTTETEGAAGPGSLVRLRGSDILAGLAAAANTYIPRYKSDTAARFVDIYKLDLIVRF